MTDNPMPERIQLRRTKGWRKPDGAIVVARPSRWGNTRSRVITMTDGGGPRFDLYLLAGGAKLWTFDWSYRNAHEAAGAAVAEYREALPRGYGEVVRSFLAGHDLACWCPLDQPCHADVLLELANAADPSELTT
jgi:hypothetical protein